MSRVRLCMCAVLCVLCWTRLPTAVGQMPADLRLLPPVEEEVISAPLLPEPDRAGEATVGDNAGTESAAEEIVMPNRELVWYDWFVPTRWDIPDEWDNSFEVGIDGSEGNSTTLSLRTGANLRRTKEWSDLKVAINYVKASADYVQTKHNGQMEIHHDWLLGESRCSGRWMPACNMRA